MIRLEVEEHELREIRHSLEDRVEALDRKRFHAVAGLDAETERDCVTRLEIVRGVLERIGR
jgi:hypothetical protein